MKNKKKGLFNIDDLREWKKHWKDMPEFEHEDLTPLFQIIVSFEKVEDIKAFSKLIGQTITVNTRSLWYPRAKIGRLANKRWIDES